jgi:competence protein ComEA
VIWRLSCLAFASFLVFTSCSPPAEVTIITRTTSDQGLIFIGGNVNNPGLYPYSVDDRIADLVSAAGGLKEGADAAEVKLFYDVQDYPQKIDINRAEAWLLEALPDVGATTAQNIIAYRQANGPFQNIDDLLKVPGIGPSTLAKIAPYIAVGSN